MFNYLIIITTIFIFLVLQYNEFQKLKKKKEKYTIFNITNIFILFIIYILLSIIYFLFFDNKNIIKTQKNIVKKIEINTDLLKKIPDNINIGFTPFDDNNSNIELKNEIINDVSNNIDIINIENKNM